MDNTSGYSGGARAGKARHAHDNDNADESRMSFRGKGADKRQKPSRPCDSVGMYLGRSTAKALLSREEETAWFQIIESSMERVEELFSRYLFAAEMHMRELDQLLAGERHFDSVVSENSQMRCAAYKKAIPDFRRGISEAMDMLSGASALYMSTSGSSAIPGEIAALLETSRREMRSKLAGLSFRQSVIEAFCDVAYEDIYVPYIEFRRKMSSGALSPSEEREAEEVVRSMESAFGMPPEEFLESFEEVRSMMGVVNSARARLAEANLRLVAHVAKKYVNRGIEMADLLQDGSIGLMTAIRKFDRARGHKFSTFATWWIRQAISRSLANNSRTVRLPSHIVDQLNKMNTAEKRLLNRLGRDPSELELSEFLGIGVDRIKQLQDMRHHAMSLDSRIGDDDASLGDVIGDDNAEDPAECTERHILKDGVREALSDLSDREKMVIDLRFGLSDGISRTLDEIGKVFNVTREHIRQVEIEAMGKLRVNPGLARLLFG